MDPAGSGRQQLRSVSHRNHCPKIVFAGNIYRTICFNRWNPMRFIIGRVQQEVRIIVEITRPSFVNLTQTLPHIALDNIRMVDCLPEPPVFNGECQTGQLKCKIMNVSIISSSKSPVCSLITDFEVK